MPLVGLGTFKTRNPETVHTVIDAALRHGYRSIDTAECYRNQQFIGHALREKLAKYDLQREDIFITSKLAPTNHGEGVCCRCYHADLQELGLTYLDLFLIHWPGKAKVKHDSPLNAELRKQSWRDMEKLYQDGYVKAIGVSNYTVRHLKELLQYCHVKPAVLQMEHHPHLVQKELIDLCQQHNIHFQAYSSLGTDSSNQLRQDKTVLRLSAKYKRSPAQILLRWAVQQNIGVLPKSTNPEHIAENIQLFDFGLSGDDVDSLSALHNDVHYCWNPDSIA